MPFGTLDLSFCSANTGRQSILSPFHLERLLNSVQSNSSRNSQTIDDIIQPGPYKEVMPCIDLCYDLVQSCPAALGFGCPQGKYQNMSYGVRDPDPGVLLCSYLGAAFYLSGGTTMSDVLGIGKMGWLSLMVTVMLLVL